MGYLYGGGCLWIEAPPCHGAHVERTLQTTILNASIGRRADLQGSRKEQPESAGDRAFSVTVSPHFRGLPNRRCQRRPRPLCRIGNHAPHMADNRKGHLVAISRRTIAAAAGLLSSPPASTRWRRLRARRLDTGIDAERYSDSGTDESACCEDQKTHGETARQVFKVAHHIRPTESRKVAERVDRCDPRRR